MSYNSTPAFLTLAEAAYKLHTHQVTSVELTEACLERIATYNSKLNAFITVNEKQALDAARKADRELNAGKDLGPLHGIPFAAKDNIDTAGVLTTGGSALFKDRIPGEDATVIRLLKAAGSVLVGKTNLQEFALGASNNSPWGPGRNPWNPLRYSGGSSSGSGAAVAAFMCYAALGTDTGGSVRIPAGYCGLVGLKPTYGLVPVRGIIPGILSHDHCGWLTRMVEDAAIMLNALAAYDPLDPTSLEHRKEDYVTGMRQPVAHLRVGIPAGRFEALQPDVERAVTEAISLLGTITKGTTEMTLPPVGNAIHLDAEILAWHQRHFEAQPDKYSEPVRRSLIRATAAKTTAVDYIRARWEMEELRRKVDDVFAEVDLVAMPTTRVVAPPIDELLQRDASLEPADPLMDYPNCIPFNVYGLPAISVPCGFSQDGMPIGMMIAGPRFSESRVLALARAYEQATDWHRRLPPL
ncbi:MAG TPA: amidase [Acidobacteriaceae bacterium]|nr:amidase [Acidobacteriaceae bacterium]